ncbi:hypothetical protein ACOMHN_028806 [Nucella lapillus]
MELGILHNSPPSTKRGCRAGRLHRLWHGLPPAPWPCTRSQHHSVPSRNLHPLMVPPFLQPHPDLQSAVGNAPLSSKHPAQLPTTDCLLSIISPMGGQPSDAPALSPPSPLQQGGQSSNAPALSPPSPLPQGGQPIALALSPPSPTPQGSQPSDAPGLSPSSSTLLLCPSDSTLNICHLNSQSAVKTGFSQLTYMKGQRQRQNVSGKGRGQNAATVPCRPADISPGKPSVYSRRRQKNGTNLVWPAPYFTGHWAAPMVILILPTSLRPAQTLRSLSRTEITLWTRLGGGAGEEEEKII